MSNLTRRTLLAAAAIAAGPREVVARVARDPRIWYVSNKGDDLSSGHSPQSPLKTLSKAMQIPLMPGDSILFERGGEYFGKLAFTHAYPWAAGSAQVRIGAYGTGAKPRICGYKAISPSAWTKVSDKIWCADINNNLNISGNVDLVGGNGANVGFIKIVTEGAVYISGRKVYSVEELSDEWSFFSDESMLLYLRSEDSPARRAISIEAAPRQDALSGVSGVCVEDLDIVGFAGHAIGASAGSHDITVQRCSVREIGGARLFGRTRYGNGVECWVNTRRIDVRGCLFQDIYDAGFTAQGFPVAQDGDGWYDIRVQENRFVRCQQMIELWSQFSAEPGEGKCPPGTGFHRIRIEHNEAYGIGYGWGNEARSGKGNACPILLYFTEAPVNDVSIRFNIISGFIGALIYRQSGAGLPDGFAFADNQIGFSRKDSKIHEQMPYLAGDWSSFVARAGIGAKSVITFSSDED